MNDSISDAINEEDNQTRNLLIKTLEDIGCQPKIDDNNNIIFKYQEEVFKVDANNDRPIIWIYNVAWTGIGTNDTDADFLKQEYRYKINFTYSLIHYFAIFAVITDRRKSKCNTLNYTLLLLHKPIKIAIFASRTNVYRWFTDTFFQSSLTGLQTLAKDL